MRLSNDCTFEYKMINLTTNFAFHYLVRHVIAAVLYNVQLCAGKDPPIYQSVGLFVYDDYDMRHLN